MPSRDFQDGLFDASDLGESGDGSGPKKHVRSQVVFRKTESVDSFGLEHLFDFPQDDISRQLKRALAEVDLSLLVGGYRDCGGVPYEPRAMLGVWLLGYALGVSSSRELERRCRFDIRFIYLSDRMQPDYRTLARFRRRLSGDLDALFKSVLSACRKQRRVQMRRVALDGTKMESPASRPSPTAEVQACGLDSSPTSDSEARFMRTAKGFVYGYNVQAAIDVDSGVVLAVSASDCPGDRSQLPPMLERIQSLTGKTPDALLADSGYDSNEAYEACRKAGCESFIPLSEASAAFWSAVDEKEVVCPMGHAPSNIRVAEAHGKFYKEYSVPRPTCTACPFQRSCCPCGRRYVTSTLDGSPSTRVLAFHRARSPEGKIARTQRLASIEPFFARTKWNRGLRRLRLRGIDGANIEMTLNALAENLILLARALQTRLDRTRNPFERSRLAKILQRLAETYALIQSNQYPQLQSA